MTLILLSSDVTSHYDEYRHHSFRLWASMTRRLKYVLYTYDTAQCRSDVEFRGILVSFYWQNKIQASYAVLQQPLFFHHIFMPQPAEGSSGVYSVESWCYIHTCVCQVRNTHVSLGGHNLGAIYARDKLWYAPYPDLISQFCATVVPLMPWGKA